jgi:hypothetical protein
LLFGPMGDTCVHMRSVVALLVLTVALGCGGTTKKRKKTNTNGKTKPVAAQVGQACKVKDPDEPQGSCAKGLMCMTDAPGGICTKPCPCGDDGVCASGVHGAFCALECSADDDCRDGYVCDKAHKVCSMEGFLGPKPPICEQPSPVPPHKAFGKATQITTPDDAPGFYNLEPASILDERTGNVVSVYMAPRGMFDPSTLGSVVVTAAGTAEAGSEVKTDRRQHFDPWLAADRKGKLYAAFLAHDGGRPEKKMMVGVSTSEDGKTWSAPVMAHDVKDCPEDKKGCLDKPMIAIGPDPANAKNDNIYVFYATDTGMRVTKSADGGKTFGASTAVAPAAYADVLVTGSGRIHVVYVGEGEKTNRFGDTGNGVFYVNSGDAGATFTPPVKVSAEAEGVPFYFSNPSIAADLSDRRLLYTAYPAGTADGKWDIILATSEDGGKTWKRTTMNDDAPCASHMVPDVAVEQATGRVHVIWLDNRSGAGGIAYASCEPFGKKCKPNELVNDKPFAAYSYVRHERSWLGEYNQLLLDAKRKVVHVIWTQPVDEDGKPTSRLFHAASKLK